MKDDVATEQASSSDGWSVTSSYANSKVDAGIGGRKNRWHVGQHAYTVVMVEERVGMHR